MRKLFVLWFVLLTAAAGCVATTTETTTTTIGLQPGGAIVKRDR